MLDKILPKNQQRALLIYPFQEVPDDLSRLLAGMSEEQQYLRGAGFETVLYPERQMPYAWFRGVFYADCHDNRDEVIEYLVGHTELGFKELTSWPSGPAPAAPLISVPIQHVDRISDAIFAWAEVKGITEPSQDSFLLYRMLNGQRRLLRALEFSGVPSPGRDGLALGAMLLLLTQMGFHHLTADRGGSPAIYVPVEDWDGARDLLVKAHSEGSRPYSN